MVAAYLLAALGLGAWLLTRQTKKKYRKPLTFKKRARYIKRRIKDKDPFLSW
jgi:hypothetical protein